MRKDLIELCAEMINRRFGSLTVLQRLPDRHVAVYECKCACGSITKTRGHRLRSGATKGCRKCAPKRRARPEAGTTFVASQIKQKFSAYKAKASRRGRVFMLDIYTFWDLVKGACFYCGTHPAGGVDRYNNSEGYTTENSVSCCWPCNQLKGVRDGDDFLSHIHLIANNCSR